MAAADQPNNPSYPQDTLPLNGPRTAQSPNLPPQTLKIAHLAPFCPTVHRLIQRRYLNTICPLLFSLPSLVSHIPASSPSLLKRICENPESNIRVGI